MTKQDVVDKIIWRFYMAISTPMLVTFTIYIFGMVLIGFIAWRSTKNFDDYILGGRSLGHL
jgi:sodium/proline symporter